MQRRSNYQNIIPEIPTNAVDIYRMLPEGTRCEVIFNELIMSPSPSSLHQLLLSDLHASLYFFLKNADKGKVIPSPIDVYLDDNVSVVQPNLLVLLNQNLDLIKADGIYGAPDLIIEILSSNRRYDTQRKRALYERAGVNEYFMIDPENKEVTLLQLDQTGAYQQVYEETALFRSEILGCSFSF